MLMSPARILLPAFLICGFLAPCQAERFALIIGNDAYTRLPPLENAGRDAELVAAALKDCGFQVATHLDADHPTLLRALATFKAQADRAEAAIIYFAGHGIELGKENYLIPTLADPTTEDQLRAQSLPLQQLLNDLTATEATLKIAILDCCRDGLLPRTRSLNRSGLSSKGLAAISPDGFAPGTAVLFAAAPGQVAADEDPSDSRHGPLAVALNRALKRSGVSARDVFDQVAEDVFTATSQKQDPWLRYDGPGRAIRGLIVRVGQ